MQIQQEKASAPRGGYRGAGVFFCCFAFFYKLGMVILPYYSFGNGSAMRVSPIGLYFDNEFGDVMNEAEKSAQITH